MQDRVKKGLGWLIAIVVVGALVYFMGQITTLTCERVNSRVDCAIESRLLGLAPLRGRAVGDVTGAQVGENCDEDGCTYRVELLTEAGMTPVTSFYSSGSLVKEDMAKAVNAFLRDPTAALLRVHEHLDPTSLIVPALFILGFFLWSRWQHHREGKHEQFVQQVAHGQQAIEDDTGWSVELVRKGLLYRCFAVTTPDGRFVVEYNPRGMGHETVLVDGKIAQCKQSTWWYVPKFEFKVGPADALLLVRVWPWFAMRSLKLIVSGQVLYAEGAATKEATPEELVDLVAVSLRTAEGPDGAASKAPMQMPKNITREKQPDSITLTRRWFEGIGVFLLFFSLLWNGIIGSILATTEPPWFVYLILLPFVGVGLFLAYLALAHIFNRTVIQLTAAALTLRHTPLPWPGNRTLPVSGLEQLYCKEVSSTDYEGDTTTSYHLRAVLNNGNEVDLLKASPETVRYLEQEIEAWLGIKDQAIWGEMRG